ncbi:MAG: glutathione S-transferase N-terminal domain-containing protein [Sutterella sp.]|nr:glutathione S-transferase N-terminal domain-containing protein [Sutterella sp.]
MMVLYSGMTCPFSHSCRFVLYEKGCEFEIQDIDMFQPIDVSSLNPYGEVPILRERDLTLYQADVINNYIDERFPHPQLMPPDPMQRARARLFSYVLNREVFSHVRLLENRNATEEMHNAARNKLRDQLTVIGTRLNAGAYLLGEEFTLLDVSLAPVLWRLDHYGIELPRTAAPLMTYGERLFSRPAFIDSMTPSERVMRR